MALKSSGLFEFPFNHLSDGFVFRAFVVDFVSPFGFCFVRVRRESYEMLGYRRCRVYRIPFV
jgi:hypothetical protein